MNFLYNRPIQAKCLRLAVMQRSFSSFAHVTQPMFVGEKFGIGIYGDRNAWKTHRKGLELKTALARSFHENSSPGSPLSAQTRAFKLIVYSKDECPLCDKLKEKLMALKERDDFLPSSILYNAEIDVRNISSKPEWMTRYAMQVPVMAAADADGSNEAEIPRASPRISADGLEKHLRRILIERFRS